MSEKKPSENEEQIVEVAGNDVVVPDSVSLSYSSGFQDKQLTFAKNNRDRAGEIEAQFENSQDKISADLKTEHQQNVVSAVVNSLAFLEGQKYWFIYRVKEEKWEFDESEKLQQTGWKGLEDAFVRMIEHINGESNLLKDSKPYNEVKALREFRRDLLHFESPMVKVGEESEEYEPEKLLTEQGFSKNPWESKNSYPFHWLSYDMAERSVRMTYTLWRQFGKELGKEDEFTKGISP